MWLFNNMSRIDITIFLSLYTWPFCGGYILQVRITCTQLYKGFHWFTRWYWPIRFDFTTVPYGDSGQSGLALQLFPLETIVTSNLIGQNKRIVQWKCFIQLGAVNNTLPSPQEDTGRRHPGNGSCYHTLIISRLWLILYFRVFSVNAFHDTLTMRKYGIYNAPGRQKLFIGRPTIFM